MPAPIYSGDALAVASMLQEVIALDAVIAAESTGGQPLDLTPEERSLVLGHRREKLVKALGRKGIELRPTPEALPPVSTESPAG